MLPELLFFVKNENGQLEYKRLLQRVRYVLVFLLECKDLILCHHSKDSPWLYLIYLILQPLIYFKDCLLVMSLLCVYSTNRIMGGQ